MHPAPLHFVENILATITPKGPVSVLEIGSYDVNGSIREVFKQSPMGRALVEYVGADLKAGPGVDVVASGSDLDFEEHRFDVVLSLECFEHNPFWKETLQNMVRMLKPGGVCIVTCASIGRPEHGTDRIHSDSSPGTQDVGWNYYWNVGLADFSSALGPGSFPQHVLQYGPAWNDLYFAGLKPGSGACVALVEGFMNFWQDAALCKERPNLQRRLTYLMESVLGRKLFQDFYVSVWRTLKPRKN